MANYDKSFLGRLTAMASATLKTDRQAAHGSHVICVLTTAAFVVMVQTE
jgi:hypothetical protein